MRGTRPELLAYQRSAEALRDVWVAARASLRAVLERVTIADIARNEPPDIVAELIGNPAAWS